MNRFSSQSSSTCECLPSRLRYFRSEDRNVHERNYPQLHYPEIYLLEGGYKAFFEYSNVSLVLVGVEHSILRIDLQEFCAPNRYRTMVDSHYQEQYRQYRAETKQCDKFKGCHGTTEGGRRTRATAFRSCLSYSSQPNQPRLSNLRYDLRYTGSPPQ